MQRHIRVIRSKGQSERPMRSNRCSDREHHRDRLLFVRVCSGIIISRTRATGSRELGRSTVREPKARLFDQTRLNYRKSSIIKFDRRDLAIAYAKSIVPDFSNGNVNSGFHVRSKSAVTPRVIPSFGRTVGGHRNHG